MGVWGIYVWVLGGGENSRWGKKRSTNNAPKLQDYLNHSYSQLLQVLQLSKCIHLNRPYCIISKISVENKAKFWLVGFVTTQDFVPV